MNDIGDAFALIGVILFYCLMFLLTIGAWCVGIAQILQWIFT